MLYFNYSGHIFPAQSAVIATDNRALRFGEGLIETALWHDGGIGLWHYHYKRFCTGAAILNFDIKTLTSDVLLDEIKKTIAANQITGDCIVRLEVFQCSASSKTGYLIECRNLIPETKAEPVVGIATTVIKCFDSISHIKSTSRLNYIIAEREAATNNWDDALLLNQYGRVAESTICNIFWEKDGALYSPPLSEGCVAGVYRTYLLNLGIYQSMRIQEAVLSISMLKTADAIYLSNAIRGLRKISLFKE